MANTGVDGTIRLDTDFRGTGMKEVEKGVTSLSVRLGQIKKTLEQTGLKLSDALGAKSQAKSRDKRLRRH